MSDLQCPATLVVTVGDDGAAATAARVAALVGDRRVVVVYAAAGASTTAREVADALSAGPGTVDGLAPLADVTSADELVRRWHPVVQELADLHRGETVLLLAPGPAPLLHGPAALVLDVDGDGWSVRSPARRG